jgi:hypothetical protein
VSYMMSQEKWAGFSKTIIGIVMMGVALIVGLGVQLSAEDVNEVRVAIEAAFGAIGLILGVVGRLSAKGTIYINPFK